MRYSACSIWEEAEVKHCVLLCLVEVQEAMRRVLRCMLSAVEGELCLLDELEVMLCMLLCMLEAVERRLCSLEVMRCILLRMLDAVEGGLSFETFNCGSFLVTVHHRSDQARLAVSSPGDWS